MILHGKNSVLERLKYNPSSINEILLQENFNDPAVTRLIKKQQIKVESVSQKKLNKIKPGDSWGGIVAYVQEFQYADFDQLLKTGVRHNLSFIFLDRVFDPQNLGAIIRNLACFGGFALVIPKHKSCKITESVVHVASGGENFVPIVIVANLTNALLRVKENGYWVAGALTEGGQELGKTNLPFPLGLVLGSEGEGIRYGVEKHLDLKLSIPMIGASLSFNVASSCSVFCYEISRQRPKMTKIRNF